MATRSNRRLAALFVTAAVLAVACGEVEPLPTPTTVQVDRAPDNDAIQPGVVFPEAGAADPTAVDGERTTTSTSTTVPGTTAAPTTAEPTTTTEPPDTDPLTLYVRPGGNDAGTGQTEDEAFGTLQHALDVIQPGQTLFIMNGTYERTGPFVLASVNGSDDAWTRITNFPGHEPVLAVREGDGFRIQSSSYVEVSGLEVRGVDFTPEWSAQPGEHRGHGILATRSHNLLIEGNEVYHFPVSGFGSESIDQTIVRGNVIHENSFYEEFQGSGISIWRPESFGFGDDENGYSIYIVGNVVYKNENRVAATPFGLPDKVTDGNGIIIDQSALKGFNGRFLIANNVIFDNGGRAVNIFQSHRVDVVHNTTYQNARSENLSSGRAEIFAAESSDVRIANNLAIPLPGLKASEAKSVDGAVSLGGNLFAGDADLRSDADQVVDGSTPLVANPSIDPAVADFSLLAESLAVDSATVDWLALLAQDFRGQTRPSGNGPDVGAIELPIK